MYKIFKSVTVHNTPVVIVNAQHKRKDAVCSISNEKDEDIEAKHEPDCQEVLLEQKKIIEDAQNQAKFLLEEASLAASEAAEELKRKGYDDGYQQGYQEGLDQSSQAIDKATTRAQEIVATGQQRATQALLAAESQMVDIALAVARKIVAGEVAENPANILAMVATALEKVRDQEQIVIRVSSDNLDTVAEGKPTLQAMLVHDSALSITLDDSLKSGDCIIDTNYGSIDARIDSQIETIKQSMRDIAYV